MVFSERPVIIGHRGLGRGVVAGREENTVASFQAAAETGAWVEIDVRRTADDRLVVRHDATLPDGRAVVRLPAAETGLPGLEEALAALPPGTGVNLDVKTEYEDAVAPRTVELLAPVLRAQTRPLFVSSFDAGALALLREAAPGVPLGLIGWLRFPPAMAISAAAHLGFQAVCLHTESFARRDERTPEDVIAAAHAAGVEVLVWCPGAEEAVRLARAGADAFCVNDLPDFLASFTR
ncbi:glycerophosphodiester phosphodiesterase [Bailinhaonella thermotolerans]|uniref:Glycerophosphodiester phosphodiesterase n=1 Tax=Bailinhaonella thermotolerans TaxID=1070861 RepID=A0A3A4APM7_9ACTN|nr:glycerophosphodiester phosphodiesterase [Bailinhaonella thermotolerans]RJL30509.1 glycerophosphodiester phosphodiesterase [Bailinhaonella thermotolerans]